jgi:hypothetical protein
VKLDKLLGTSGVTQAIGELKISDSPIILISCSLFGFIIVLFDESSALRVYGPESYKHNELLDENDN